MDDLDTRREERREGEARAPRSRDIRLPYRAPRLVRFGSIAKLTRGGEGTDIDGGGGGFDFTGAEP